MNQDEAQLNNLALAHYIVGGVMMMVSCLPLIHVCVGLLFLMGGSGFFPETSCAPPPFFGWLFLLMGFVFFVLAQASSISVIVSGRFLKKRKNYLFSFIVACIACAFVPFGTILGVFTIVVLSRESVKKLYDNNQ
jgi:hypothetical protein